MKLTTATDLAGQFDITEGRLHTLRVRHNWPHVKFGRNDVRFTDAQIEQIVALESRTTSTKPKSKSKQTSRSAARTS